MLVSSSYSWQTGAENCPIITQKETLATIIFQSSLIRGAQNGHPCGARIIVILVCKTISSVVKKMMKTTYFQGQDVNHLYMK